MVYVNKVKMIEISEGGNKKICTVFLFNVSFPGRM